MPNNHNRVEIRGNAKLSGASAIQGKRESKPRIQTAARTIALLQEVANAGAEGASAQSISQALMIPRQIVYNLIHTLVSVDMLRSVGNRSYVLGLGVASLASGFRRQLLSQDMVGYSQKVADITGETAYVVSWIGPEIVVLASSRGSLPIHAAELPQGAAGDAHARATGKLLLAMSLPEEVDQYLRSHPLRRMTSKTFTTKQALIRNLNVIRKTWVSVDDQEYANGLSCVAVPIGQPPSQMALGLSTSTERLKARKDEYVAILRRIAQNRR
jgi:DNA-binding IclR family transcriptional regulator